MLLSCTRGSSSEASCERADVHMCPVLDLDHRAAVWCVGATVVIWKAPAPAVPMDAMAETWCVVWSIWGQRVLEAAFRVVAARGARIPYGEFAC